MDENTGAVGTQAVPTTQPQAGATQTAQAASAEPETPLDTATLQRELVEARREAARYRSEAKKHADAQAIVERSALTEQERITRDRSEYEREREGFTRERQEFALERLATKAASAVGFADPEVAFRMIDRSALEFGDDGQPRGLERHLRDILQRHPTLVAPSRTATVTRGVQQSGTASGDWNAALRRVAGGG